MLHHEGAALFQDFEIAVIGAADRNAVVARRRLDPDVFKSGLPRHPAVGHAVQRHAAGDAEVLGAGRFAQPAGAREQHLFGIVLNPPGEILPMPHRRAGFPFLAAAHDVRLIELRGPVRNVKVAAVDIEQGLDLLPRP